MLPPPEPTVITTLLVVTFAPRPDDPLTATDAVADTLAGDERIISHVVEVSWERSVAEARSLVRLSDPSAVVLFATSPSSRAVRLEEHARNLADGGPDVDGAWRSAERIDAAGPDTLASRLPVAELMTTLLSEGLPAERSADAGTGVVNHLHHELLRAPELQGRPTGLVTVPVTQDGWTSQDVVRAGCVVVTTLLHHLPPDPR